MDYVNCTTNVYFNYARSNYVIESSSKTDSSSTHKRHSLVFKLKEAYDVHVYSTLFQ